MLMRAVLLSVVVAALTSVATTSFWVFVGSASASARYSGPYKVVIGLMFKESQSKTETTDPGGITVNEATCDSKDGWDLVSGGYEMAGINGEAVASVTASHADGYTWRTVVANPKLASNPVQEWTSAYCIKPLVGTIQATTAKG